MHHCLNELENNFDRIRQAVIHIHEKVKNRISNTAASYTSSDPAYALVPFVAAISDAILGFVGGYDLVRAWIPERVPAALLDAGASLTLGASLVIMCWLSDLCRDSGSKFRRWAFTAFSVAPLLMIGAPVVYFTFSWFQTRSLLELERLLKIAALAVIAAIAHSFLFFEGDTCMDGLQKWLLVRDKKALALEVVRLRDVARTLVSAWNAARQQAEQQNEESGANGFHLPAKHLGGSESLQESLDAARAVLAAQDLVEVVRQIRNPAQNRANRYEPLQSPLGAEAGD
jgi:hypothetical protein